MSIILAILSTILLVILFLLLAILILMLIIMLTPIRYNARVSYIDEKLAYDVKASWLMRLVFVHVKHSEAGDKRLFRVAWKHFLEDAAKEQAESKDVSEDKKEEKVKERDPPEEATKKAKSESKKKEPEKPKVKLIDKVKNFYGGLVDKFRNISDKIERFKELDLDLRALFSDTMLAFKRLFLALKPKVLLLDLELGLESPDQTGMAIGGLAVLEELIESTNRRKHKIIVKGNFEEKVINVDSTIKGRVSLWNLIWPFLRLYFAKSMQPIRQVVMDKLFKKDKTRRKRNG